MDKDIEIEQNGDTSIGNLVLLFPEMGRYHC